MRASRQRPRQLLRWHTPNPHLPVRVSLAGVHRLAERGLGPGDGPPVGEQLFAVMPDVDVLCPDRDDDLVLLALTHPEPPAAPDASVARARNAARSVAASGPRGRAGPRTPTGRRRRPGRAAKAWASHPSMSRLSSARAASRRRRQADKTNRRYAPRRHLLDEGRASVSRSGGLLYWATRCDLSEESWTFLRSSMRRWQLSRLLRIKQIQYQRVHHSTEAPNPDLCCRRRAVRAVPGAVPPSGRSGLTVGKPHDGRRPASRHGRSSGVSWMPDIALDAGM